MHGFFQDGAGQGGDRPSGGRAAGQGDGLDQGILNDRRQARGAHQQRAKQRGWESGLMENRFDGQGAAADVGGVFEHGGVASHQRRNGKTEHLPEGEIPGHDGQHDAQGLKGHIAFRGVARDDFRGQETGAVVGIILANPGAFFDFRASLSDRLAHFVRHELRIVSLVTTQDQRHLTQPGGAVVKFRAAPTPEGLVGGYEKRLDGVIRQLGVGGDPLVGRGIDGLENGHDLIDSEKGWFVNARNKSSRFGLFCACDQRSDVEHIETCIGSASSSI